MQGVVLDPLGLDRPEGAQADMQGDVNPVDPPSVQAVEDLCREVQTGRRCGDRTRDRGIKGLIPHAVARFFASFANIRRQRDVAVPFQQLGRRLVLVGLDDPAAAVAPLNQGQPKPASRTTVSPAFGRPLVVARISQRPSGKARRNRPSQFPPVASRLPINRAGTTLVLFRTRTSPGREQIGQVGKDPMLPDPRRPSDDHQPRAVSRFGRMLGDQPGRQLKVKRIGLQTKAPE